MRIVPSASRRTIESLVAIRTGRMRRPLAGGGRHLRRAAPPTPKRAAIELLEGAPFASEALEERRRFPSIAELTMECGDAFVHRLHADEIRVEHRPAAPAGEPVAGEIDHVDVGGAKGEALVEDARAFVD
jgi:hypothetical protein